MKNIIKAMTALLIALIFAVTPAYSWQSIDFNRMEKNLSVSEDILKNMLSDRTHSQFFSESSVKGVYLDGHGVVFMIPMTRQTYSGNKAQTARENHQALQNDLLDFLGSYAGVIKQIKPNDRITIVATPSQEHTLDVFYTMESEVYASSGRSSGKNDKFVPKPFIMTVKKADVDKARSGSLSDAQFKNVVTITTIGNGDESYVKKSMLKDIKIIRSIIDVSLEDEFGKSISGSAIQGTYIKDYGVIITINTGSSIAVPFNMVDFSEVVAYDRAATVKVSSAVKKTIQTKLSDLEKALAVQEKELEALRKQRLDKESVYYDYVRALDRNKGSKSNEQYMKDLIEVMVEALGDYGHTLRGLKSTEKITILYKSRGYRLDVRGKQNMMMTISYKDVESFARGSLTLAAFKEKVTVTMF